MTELTHREREIIEDALRKATRTFKGEGKSGGDLVICERLLVLVQSGRVVVR